MTITLVGNWDKGFAYDVHTLSSVYLGTDEQGYKQFDTTYSEMGTLVRRLKYEGDRKATPRIVDLLERYKGIETFDAIIPAPSSRKDRLYQPVDEIALELGRRAGVAVLVGTLRKAGGGKELKNIDDPDQRTAELRKTISLAENSGLDGKKLLLLDDLYRSGATLSVSTDILYREGHAETVSVLTMTKTRSRR